MKQLVTFKTQYGEKEYFDYGVYNQKYSDEEIIKHFHGLDNLVEDEKGSEEYWLDTSLVRVYSRLDIDDEKIKTMLEYGIAYEHNIEGKEWKEKYGRKTR